MVSKNNTFYPIMRKPFIWHRICGKINRNVVSDVVYPTNGWWNLSSSFIPLDVSDVVYLTLDIPDRAWEIWFEYFEAPFHSYILTIVRYVYNTYSFRGKPNSFHNLNRSQFVKDERSMATLLQKAYILRLKCKQARENSFINANTSCIWWVLSGH